MNYLFSGIRRNNTAIMAVACVYIYLFIVGSSQNPLCDTSVSRGIVTGSVGEVDVDSALDADPVCIRCGRGLNL